MVTQSEGIITDCQSCEGAFDGQWVLSGGLDKVSIKILAELLREWAETQQTPFLCEIWDSKELKGTGNIPGSIPRWFRGK